MKSVYIMSSPRGGSTLLSLVLGRHADIANLGEVSFIPKLLALDELCTCQDQLNACSEWQSVFNLIKQETGADMLSDPYALHLDDVMKHKSGTGKIDHQYQTKWRMARSKLRGGIDAATLKYFPASGVLPSLPSIRKGADNTLALYQAAAKAWGKQVVVDASKLPRKAVHLYRQAPDNVRIIHLTRDSRGVAASRKSHMQLAPAAQRWNYYHAMSLDLVDKWIAPEHCVRLKYEDFVNDPAAKMGELCDWLEIPHSEQTLDFDVDIKTHSAGGNPTRFKFSEGIRPVDERWRTILSESDLAEVETICGDVSRRLGY